MPTREPAVTGAPNWIDLLSSDTASSKAFYTELFGWTAEEASEEFGGYITFKKDGVQVAGAMGRQPDNPAPDAWSVYLATDDAAKTLEIATAHGGKVMLDADARRRHGRHGIRRRPRRRRDRRLAGGHAQGHRARR